MQPKSPLSEVDRLKAQVKWLDEQLGGHEENFNKQFERISILQERVKDLENQLLEQQHIKAVDDAKIASLANYITALDEAPMLKVLKPANRKEMRRIASITAYEAAAFRGIFEELEKLINLDVPEGEEHAILTEAKAMLKQAAFDMGFHAKKIHDAV